MIVNKCSENLLTKSKKLYENYRDNCIVVQRMLAVSYTHLTLPTKLEV